MLDFRPIGGRRQKTRRLEEGEEEKDEADEEIIGEDL
jgi:hypothetical protein